MLKGFNWKVGLAAAAFALAASAANAVSIRVFENLDGSGLAVAEESGVSSTGVFGTFSGIDVTIATGSATGYPPSDNFNSSVDLLNSVGGASGPVRIEVTQTFDNAADALFYGNASGSIEGLDESFSGSFTVELFLAVGSGTPYDLTTAPGSVLSAGFGSAVDTAAGEFAADLYTVTAVYLIDGFSGQGNGDTQFTASPVPVPGAAVLLMSGIGGFAALRRRKKA